MRDRYDALVERGQAEVRHWADVGRTEEARRGALAQTTINQLIENTMEELVESPRFEMLVQNVVEAKSQGIADEVIEEIRERSVTLDTLSERFVRKRLGRPPRESLPTPTLIIERIAKRAAPGATILLAPQSGEETRTVILRKNGEIRDRMSQSATQAVDDARVRAGELAAAKERASEL